SLSRKADGAHQGAVLRLQKDQRPRECRDHSETVQPKRAPRLPLIRLTFAARALRGKAEPLHRRPWTNWHTTATNPAPPRRSKSGSVDAEGGGWFTPPLNGGGFGFTRAGAREPGDRRDTTAVAGANRMVFLGFGKYARADKIYAIEPIRDDRRGHGRRTLVWVE